MANKADPQLVGQGLLFEGLVPVELDLNWQRPTSLNRLLDRLSNSDVAQGAMGSIAAGSMAIVEPVTIEDALVGAKGENVYGGLAFPAEEFVLIPRSPRSLIKSPQARAEMTQRRLGAGEESVASARARAAGHVMASSTLNVERLQAHLTEEKRNLDVVLSELRAPWRAHYKAEDLLMRVTGARLSIEKMVEVAGGQLGWSTEQHHLAKKIIAVRLLGLHGNGNERNNYLRQYATATRRYNARRSGVVKRPLHASEIVAKQNQPRTNDQTS